MAKFSMNPEIEQVGKIAEYAAMKARELEAKLAPEQIAGLQRDTALVMAHLKDLSALLQNTGASKIGGGNGNPDVERVENIPGRRLQFDYLTEIAVNTPSNGSLSELQGTFTIDQSGPFVAVKRYCTFLSNFQAQFKDPETGSVLTFLGRSNGRFRPISSSFDLNDAILPADVTRVVAAPGTGDPSYSSPALHSPYRTMEFDGRIEVRATANSYPRSNIKVPSCFWTTQINAPFALGALDFLGRSEVVEFRVVPTHTLNPRAGNLSAFLLGGPYPFPDAQYDHHEGVSDPFNPAVTTQDPDPVTRVPTGTLIIGYEGFRIIQPPGAVVNLGMV